MWLDPCRLVVTCWERLTFWLSCTCMWCFLCFLHFPIWCPGSGAVYICMYFWSMPSALLCFSVSLPWGYKFVSCSTELSMKFQLLLKSKILQTNTFLAFKLLDVVFIMLHLCTWRKAKLSWSWARKMFYNLRVWCLFLFFHSKYVIWLILS